MEAHKHKPHKNEVFILRLSETDKKRLSDQAKEQNLSMSSYVRTKLLNNSKNEKAQPGN